VKVGSGYRLVLSVGREWIPSDAVSRQGVNTVRCCQSVGSGYRLVLSVGREWIPSDAVSR
jgi:hypothetical protein